METVLVSDFLLVQVPGQGWLPFRDVFERDGKQVRNREERLAALFLSGSRSALDQARAIMDEGARYNIGNVSRNINVPTLPLPFLTSLHKGRFAFKIGKREDGDPGEVIEFRETARPTFVTTAAIATCLSTGGSGWTRGTGRCCAPSFMPSIRASRGTSSSATSSMPAPASGCRREWKSGIGVDATRTRCTAWPRIRDSGASRSAPARKSLN